MELPAPSLRSLHGVSSKDISIVKTRWRAEARTAARGAASGHSYLQRSSDPWNREKTSRGMSGAVGAGACRRLGNPKPPPTELLRRGAVLISWRRVRCRPFDYAQGRPFDYAHGRTFNTCLD